MPAEDVGWGLTPGREGVSGLPTDEKPAQIGLERLVELSTISNGSTTSPQFIALDASTIWLKNYLQHQNPAIYSTKWVIGKLAED